MNRYRFTGLTDSSRLVGTMMEQSKMEEGEALFIVKNILERCVEVWDGDKLCWYFLILTKDNVRQLHGYGMVKGRARHALRIAGSLLEEEKGNLYSGHDAANMKINRFLKLLGFKDKITMNGVTFMGKI